ncbi:hypothetical protein [Sinorhizobium medicae]|uniref:Transmembrane protein n=2 Tax=Sinorhizobium medicae TaxID=110321 RepID=A0A508X3A1_9HYPH|nr:hypothetical protein [Sinorhizobium medicae]ABR61973.1 hypothetical protein Smed_3149 [Sinorhizobium medicae WSM419]MDX0404414.1 hypothetical protein [Sinorhizobium medicae]MDX0410351.1 hypothetical protein [Sinorhizobium medicae]MDX0416114.1 hypothetical protein [Sinorhizobium medicae]MDX0422972.1 hypothetical protein [Sinorhizobium medicae]
MTQRLPSAWRLPVLSLAIVLVVIFGFGIHGRINSAMLLGDMDLSSDVDVTIGLSFEPERFHLEKFQDTGRYQGWSDGRALILSADPEALRKLARNYWIGTIEPYEAPE